MTSPASPSPLPPIRRIITGHDKSGKAIIVHDGHSTGHPFKPGDNSTSFIDLYRTEEFPSSNGHPGEAFVDPTVGKESELMSEGGSGFRAVELAPGSVSVFHRTISVDYAIVTHGSVVCVLDDGKRITLDAGDVLVQRGTIHAWVNESKTEWARTYFVMLPSKEIEHEGKPLEMEFRELTIQ